MKEVIDVKGISICSLMVCPLCGKIKTNGAVFPVRERFMTNNINKYYDIELVDSNYGSCQLACDECLECFKKHIEALSIELKARDGMYKSTITIDSEIVKK